MILIWLLSLFELVDFLLMMDKKSEKEISKSKRVCVWESKWASKQRREREMWREKCRSMVDQKLKITFLNRLHIYLNWIILGQIPHAQIINVIHWVNRSKSINLPPKLKYITTSPRHCVEKKKQSQVSWHYFRLWFFFAVRFDLPNEFVEWREFLFYKKRFDSVELKWQFTSKFSLRVFSKMEREVQKIEQKKTKRKNKTMT